MKRTLTALIVMLMWLVATTALAHFPETLTVSAAAKKQAPVTFSHGKHGTTYAKSCDTCHHTQKGLKKTDEKVDVKKCSTCHLDPKDAKVPSMRDMSLAKNPMHVRCVGCHKAEKKGPTACTGCHVKVAAK